jgi:DNA invertase Pin-like site-specific DNA recombinase
MMMNEPLSTNKQTSHTVPHIISHDKIKSTHLERAAMVYIRQSTPQQVSRHKESTEIQYNLKSRALEFGWPENRIEIIDDDLGLSGKTAVGRKGFQRLVAEVSLDRVGIILGVEMSRIARCCKDWYQLLEACAIFDTLIGDLDGIYDPSLYNDRLLLGLKGTMSEAELHILKQRMQQGKLNKAKRGDLNFNLPKGYIRRPNGEVVKDPDEQVQEVICLIFKKFNELKTINATLQYMVKNKIQIGVRVNGGVNKGELEWRRASRTILQTILKNPAYAGAYVYGRRKVDHKHQKPGHPFTGRKFVKAEDCQVFLKDRLPAYITWEEYERNRRQLQANRAVYDEIGAVRKGKGLLGGLLICKKCGRRMSIQYHYDDSRRYQYVCNGIKSSYGEKNCQSIPGIYMDKFIETQILEVLKPASIELHLEATKHLEKERKELDAHWQKKLERIDYECARAERQYNHVEPENRLVARQLEKEWEQKLQEKDKLEKEYSNFQKDKPKIVTPDECQIIRQLSKDIPDLWNDKNTTITEKKQIVRQLIEGIELDVVDHTEQVKVCIRWAGNCTSEYEIVKPVRKFEQLSYYPLMIKKIKELFNKGCSAAEIAEKLNKAGLRPPKKLEQFNEPIVRRLLSKYGLKKNKKHIQSCEKLSKNEWLINDLSVKLGILKATLYSWIRRNEVKARKTNEKDWKWIIIADEKEMARLKELYAQPPGHKMRQHWLNK